MPDNKTLDKVRRLLAQAEDQAGTPEGDAFSAKAEELMIRHGIEQAILDAGADGTKGDLGATRIFIPAPYAKEKTVLLGAVSENNTCRAVIHWHRSPSGRRSASNGVSASIYGFDRDRDAAELLFTSLSLQAARGLHSAHEPAHEDLATFRSSWMLGFASEVWRRMKDMRTAAKDDVVAATSGADLVLTDKSTQVAEYVDGLYGDLDRRQRTMQTSGSGVGDGRRAARRADLGQHRVSDSRKQLAN